jgi:hypothetical protein
MRLLSTKVHGVLDYLVAILLIASPWMFNFARNGAETWVPVVLGVGAIAYSLLTNYEMGASRTLSMRSHLTLDMLSGAFLAASPWLFNFDDVVYMPHLIVGIMEIVVAMITEKAPRHADDQNSVHVETFNDGVHGHAH